MKRDEKKHAIKKRIIESIFEIVHNKPFDLVSVNEICSKADVSKRTLYSYYKSKDEMYLALVLLSFTRLNRSMENSLNKAEVESDIEQVLALGRGYLTFFIKYKTEAYLINSFDETRYLDVDSATIEKIRGVANKYELTSFFNQEQFDPQLYTPELALMMWSTIQGFAQLMANKNHWIEQYYDKSSDELIRLLMDQIREFVRFKKEEQNEEKQEELLCN